MMMDINNKGEGAENREKANRYNEYDMWFSDNAGNKISEIFNIMKDAGSCEEIYNSRHFPKWKRNADKYRNAIELFNKHDIKLCGFEDPEYPERLKNIFDPPYILYYRGKLPDNNMKCCSVVGSRKASLYGRKTSYEVGRLLGSEGVAVISGMALGADSCAHQGALDGGGYTLAVLGSGVDQCTPISNKKLMSDILESGGCVISEFLPGTPGYSGNYPKRNRIISGISEYLIVTEAGEKSGTSITANLALEQGRDVIAVPGNITSSLSRGTNRLIRDGAQPLLSVKELTEILDLKQKHREEVKIYLSREELEIYRIVENLGSASIDELCLNVGRTPSQISGIVTVLEIKGFVFRSFGKIIVAK